MIPVTNLRNGTTFEDGGQIYQVLHYEHIKMGRGTATIKLKVKNVKTGTTNFKSFISGAKVNAASLDKKELQFLYRDQNLLSFMDPKTFNQLNIPQDKLDDDQFLKEGEVYTVSFYQDLPLGIILPPKMELKVVETGPGIRGNSTSNIYKDAILENGMKVRVPLFIKIGDRILVDTKTHAYHEKSNTV